MTGRGVVLHRRAGGWRQLAVVMAVVAAFLVMAPPAHADFPEIGFWSSESVVSEAGSDVTVEVLVELKTGGLGYTSPLTFQVVDAGTGSAVAADFTIVPPPGGTYQFDDGIDGDGALRTVFVTIHPDSLDEAQETVDLAFASITNGDPDPLRATHQIKINDDDPTPTISISDETVTEGSSAVFDVTLSAESGQEVRVDYTTAPDTASTSDYTTTSGTLVFAPGSPGETTKTVTVATADDSSVESTEAFTVELSDESNATVFDGTGVGTINDNDNATVSVSNESVTEGGTMTFDVTLSAQSTSVVTVDYATGDLSASAGSDYTAVSSPPALSFAPGQTTRTVDVATIQDSIDEINETLNLNLTGVSGATIADGSGLGTILDNDTAGVSVVQSGGSTNVTEGGATDTYTVALTTQPTANVTVTVSGDSQVAGSALAAFTPSNYSAKTVTVSANSDSAVEGSHSGTITHTATSSDPFYNGIGIPSVVAAVTDNNFSLDFVQGASSPAEGHSGTSAVTVVVQLETAGQNLGPAGASARVVVTGGTAQPTDYSFAPTSVTFPAGSPDGTTRSVTVNVIGDTLNEPAETVILGMDTVAANGSIAGQTTHTVNILNDDGPPGLTVIDAVPVLEGGPGMVFTISLLPASGQTVRVDYSTADGTATSASDYTPTTGYVEFAPGETSKQTSPVSITNDTTDEITETLLLNLSGPVNAAIADAQGSGSILDNDNVSPTVTLFQTLDQADSPMFQFGTGDTVKIRVNFTDPGIADAHIVTVNWGDGSTPTTFPMAPVGARAFEQTHTFAAAGFYQISASIADGDGGSGADERFVTVSGPSVGSGNDTAGLVDPTRGVWRLDDAAGTVVTEFYYGVPGDYPFMGDWDGDGIETPGLYRQADGYVYLRNSNTQGIANIKFFFGNPGDVPIAGDFNGDGFDTVSIYRPSNQRFYIINKLGSNDGGLGAAETDYVFGNPGDKPFVGDFDGDGIETVGLHRESTGLVYFRNSHTQGNADHQFIFGDPGDKLVAGDWNGDGVDAPAVYRTSDRWFYFRHTNTQGNSDSSYYTGVAGWIPVAGMVGL